jgi:small-conductance mechanosensitive channel
MTPAAFVLVPAQEPDPLIDACGEIDRSYVCEQVFEWTNSKFLATAAESVTDHAIPIILILGVAWIASRLLQRVVARFVDTVAASPSDPRFQALRERGPARLLVDENASARAAARAETIGIVLRSIVAGAVWSVASLLVLGELEINLAPLIAGAGIGGIALGFGAQTVVRDFLSGLFILIEDQYGVGDIIDIGPATGTVEKVSLRSTSIRDVQGTVWHVPNGEIVRVGNFSQLWSRALIDVEVAYDTDIEFAQGVIQRVADEMWEDDHWGRDEVMERPEVWGVQSLGASSVAIRVVVKTEPSEQWAVERELRLRLKTALDEAGIEIPFPQQTVWVRHQGEYPVAARPDPSTIVVHNPAEAHDDEASG